ncbi:MAG: TraB/GumN family protein [Pseudomonadota bacterium]
MRLLFLFGLLLLPMTAQAACEGRDLRLQMSSQDRAALARALEHVPYPEGNHWIARKDDTVLHLIGTLHTNDPRMDAVVQRLIPVLRDVDTFYFEVTQDQMDAFEQSLGQDLSPVMITSGPTLIDLMTADEWARLSATLAEHGIPGWMAAKMRPWFLSMMLGIPPCLMQDPNAKHGMDARLTELAAAYDIPQHSLERVEDLMAIFDTHPIEDQVKSLLRLSGALHTSEDQLATMVNAYMEGKHAEIIQLARQHGFEASGLTRAEFEAEWDSFEQQLLVQRNENWMRHILAIKDQTAVIAVGAGHLSDTHGLLRRLEMAGYTLSRAPF